jgi:aminoglycoside 6'-N-acetyltransferase
MCSILIRKMAEADFPLMAKWLSNPLVLQFYGDINSPFSLEMVVNKYGPRVEGIVPIRPLIVELNEIPIGYMQKYRITEEDRLQYGYPPHLMIYGIDQFIGETELLGKGFGTSMVKMLVGMIKKEERADVVVLDPEMSNLRAIRCYEKAGFKVVKPLDHKRLLMACEL